MATADTGSHFSKQKFYTARKVNRKKTPAEWGHLVFLYIQFPKIDVDKHNTFLHASLAQRHMSSSKLWLAEFLPVQPLPWISNPEPTCTNILLLSTKLL